MQPAMTPTQARTTAEDNVTAARTRRGRIARVGDVRNMWEATALVLSALESLEDTVQAQSGGGGSNPTSLPMTDEAIGSAIIAAIATAGDMFASATPSGTCAIGDHVHTWDVAAAAELGSVVRVALLAAWAT